jgi:ATP-binding cassette, subfamily A (ABC1), member 3
MAEGQLRCLGSSLFLKKTYGVGYQLTIEKQPVSAKKVTEKGVDIDTMMNRIVKRSVREATLLTNVGTELSYQLPLGAAANFNPMFEHLDHQVEKGGIVTYGVGITTLDEVFLLVARGESSEKSKLKLPNKGGGADAAHKDYLERSARSKMDLETEGLFVRHVNALFRKRALNFKRDKKAWVSTSATRNIFVPFAASSLLVPVPTVLHYNFTKYFCVGGLPFVRFCVSIEGARCSDIGP